MFVHGSSAEVRGASSPARLHSQSRLRGCRVSVDERLLSFSLRPRTGVPRLGVSSLRIGGGRIQEPMAVGAGAQGSMAADRRVELRRQTQAAAAAVRVLHGDDDRPSPDARDDVVTRENEAGDLLAESGAALPERREGCGNVACFFAELLVDSGEVGQIADRRFQVIAAPRRRAAPAPDSAPPARLRRRWPPRRAHPEPRERFLRAGTSARACEARGGIARRT